MGCHRSEGGDRLSSLRLCGSKPFSQLWIFQILLALGVRLYGEVGGRVLFDWVNTVRMEDS